MRIPWILIIGLFISVPAVAGETELPLGYHQANWGMTVLEVSKEVPMIPAGGSGGFGYAEHLEEDPDVYTWTSPKHERVEYYFYRGKLYKIFIVYDRIFFHTKFYEKLIDQTQKAFGEPGKNYQEEYFGLSIQHVLWEDRVSVLDLRKGGGFIYQVRIDKSAAEEKTKASGKRKGT